MSSTSQSRITLSLAGLESNIHDTVGSHGASSQITSCSRIERSCDQRQDCASLGHGGSSTNIEGPTHRRVAGALYVEPPPLNEVQSSARCGAPVGLGLGLGTEFHLSFSRSPVVPSSLQRVESDGTPIMYSFRPPGLSTPIPLIEEPEWLAMPRNEQDIVPLSGTALLRLPSISRGASHASSGFTPIPSRSVTACVPATPRLQSIDHFVSDPLYV